MRLWFWIAFLVASFTVLTYGQEQTAKTGITVVNSGQRLTAAEAAAILLGPAMQSNQTGKGSLPTAAVPSVVIPSVPAASTWMTFPKTSEQRRLDGTPISMPPANYGGTQILIVAPEVPR